MRVRERYMNVPGLSRDRFGVLKYAYRHRLGTYNSLKHSN